MPALLVGPISKPRVPFSSCGYNLHRFAQAAAATQAFGIFCRDLPSLVFSEIPYHFFLFVQVYIQSGCIIIPLKAKKILEVVNAVAILSKY